MSVRHLAFSKFASSNHVTCNCSDGTSFVFKVLISRPIWRRDIAENDFQYCVTMPSWISNIIIFRLVAILEIRIRVCKFIFHRNRIQRKTVFKWRPSTVVNFRNLLLGHVACVFVLPFTVCAVAQHCYNGDVSFLWEKWKL